MFQRWWVLSITLNCSHVRTLFLEFQESQRNAGFDLSFMQNVVVFSSSYGIVSVPHCDAGYDHSFKPNVVVLSAGGYGNVFVSLWAGLESVEKNVPMDQRVCWPHARSMFPAPNDMRKRLAEIHGCWANCVVLAHHGGFSCALRSSFFEECGVYVYDDVMAGIVMVDSRVSFVPQGMYRSRICLKILRSLATC